MAKLSFRPGFLLYLLFTVSAAAQTFQGASVQTVSGSPAVMATADFNRDGRPDIVYQDAFTGGSLHVMDGNGDGTFREVQQVELPAGVGAHITAADLNGDGFPDLIVGYDGFDTNFVPAEFTVLINHGDGTLGTPIASTFPIYAEPETVLNDVAVADFDGDGHTDFIFAASAGVIMMRGDGTGHFSPAIVGGTQSDVLYDVYVGDFNGDGRPDIAVNGFLGIYYALNSGSGSFTWQTLVKILMNPSTGFRLADVDSDGHPDILFGATGSLRIAYGKGDGTFAAPVIRGTAPPPVYFGILGVRDANGDGRADVITVNSAGPAVDLQDASGNFSYTNQSGPAIGDKGYLAPVYADFDGDGIYDVVSGATGALIFSKGRSNGTFNGARATVTGADTLDIQAADFNRDGKLDLVATVGGGGNFGTLAVFNGDGIGNFTQGGPLKNSVTYAGQSTVADLNGDGIPDVFNAGYALEGDGLGGFASPTLIAAPPAKSYPVGYTVVADFNEDGRLDAVTGTRTTIGDVGSGLAVGLSSGPNTWTTTQIPLPADPGPLVTADFNHDGHQDLATASLTLDILNGDGKGNFTLAQSLPIGYQGPCTGAIHCGWTDLEAADIDGDGNIDLLLPIADHNLIQIFYGRGDGTFETPVALTTAQDVRFVTVHDMDGDGIPDLILGGHALVRILHGMGHRVFEATPTSYAANPYPQKVRVADVNGDGNPDLVVPNGGYSSILEYGQTFTVLLNNAAPAAPDALSGTIVCSPEPSLLGQPFSCTATFTPLDNSASPVGTVTFLLDGSPAGSGTLAGRGVTVAFAAGSAVGPHMIEADFSGDANFRATKATTIHTVAKAKASLVLTGAAHIPFGQPLLLSVTASGGFGVPTGTIMFEDGTAVLGQTSLSAGTASFSTSALTVGTHMLVANYVGDTTYGAGASNQITVIVDAQPTQTALTVSSPAAPFGTTITLQATVTATSGTATGTVIFLDGAVQIGSVPLDARGVAQMQTSSLALGTHNLTAQFSGSTAFAASVSYPVSVSIIGISTNTVLTAAPNPSYRGQGVTFTATVTTASPQPLSGSVLFLDGTAPLGNAVLNAVGAATLSTSTLTVGSHTITAQFTGSGVLVPSSSSALQQVVLDGGFSLSSPANITIQTQHHTTFNLVVTPLGQFSGPVQLSCAALPNHATCSLASQSVLLTSTAGPQTVSVYFDTSDVLGYASAHPLSRGDRPAMQVVAGLLSPLVLVLGMAARRHRRSMRLLSGIGVLGLCMTLSLFTGCTGAYPASVAPGSYSLRFTGASTNPSLSQTSTTVVTVTP